MVAIYFILTIIPSSLFLTLFGSENVPQNVFVWLFYHKTKKIYEFSFVLIYFIFEEHGEQAQIIF